MAEFEFDFDDLKAAETPVRFKGVDYVLREASEAAHVAYQNAIAKAVRLGPDKTPVSFEGIASTRVALVAACLFAKIAGGESAMTPVELATWPAKVVKRLYEWVEEASEINAKDTPESIRKEIAKLERRLEAMAAEDPSKNGHSATTPTSPQPAS